MICRKLFGAMALAAAAAVLVAPAAAQSAVQDPLPIGPHESFTGLVNGSASNAVIRMGCFGPTRIGQTGHPLAGQSVEVALSPSLTGPGYTGTATSIAAVLSYPTPLAGPAATVLATFGSFYAPAPISTSLTLPCYGSGSVAFAPVSGGSTARAAVVKVTFAGQP